MRWEGGEREFLINGNVEGAGWRLHHQPRYGHLYGRNHLPAYYSQKYNRKTEAVKF